MNGLHRASLCGFALVAFSCREPYRVGEHVVVEYEDSAYPAFVREKTSRTQLKVQFEGCDATWVRKVSLDRVRARVDEERAPPPGARSYACAPKPRDAGAKVTSAPYVAGDKVRVLWRGSIYSATILSVLAPDQFRVHYEGLEDAWDEAVPLKRIVGRR